MFQEINALGQACPMPVVLAKKALAQMETGTLHVLVDNRIAVENLERFAQGQNAQFRVEDVEGGNFRAVIVKGEKESAPTPAPTVSAGDTLVVISSQYMGEGDITLGGILMKGFLFALTQLDTPPQCVLLYNGGAFLSVEGSQSVEDLQALAAAGTEILTCGTCLNHYGIAEQLAVGGVTNMYAIAEKMAAAGRVIRP